MRCERHRLHRAMIASSPLPAVGTASTGRDSRQNPYCLNRVYLGLVRIYWHLADRCAVWKTIANAAANLVFRDMAFWWAKVADLAYTVSLYAYSIKG